MVEKPDIKKIKENFLNKLELQFNVEPSQASDKQIYQALSAVVVEELKKKRQKFINNEGGCASNRACVLPCVISQADLYA